MGRGGIRLNGSLTMLFYGRPGKCSRHHVSAITKRLFLAARILWSRQSTFSKVSSLLKKLHPPNVHQLQSTTFLPIRLSIPGQSHSRYLLKRQQTYQRLYSRNARVLPATRSSTPQHPPNPFRRHLHPAPRCWPHQRRRRRHRPLRTQHSMLTIHKHLMIRTRSFYGYGPLRISPTPNTLTC